MIINRRRLGLVQKNDLPSARYVKRVVEAVLRSEKVKNKGEINVVFVDNRVIKKLNQNFLKKDRPTDVIAFPYFIENKKEVDSPLGDVYISMTVAKQNARLYNQSLHKEITRLIVHGMLHLLGYTDYVPVKKKKMWSRQEALVRRLCLSR